ncbi:MAG TPA: chromate resistance protein ChrB domain-containing protein [Gallionellaceae bacterium]|nr:chromate resistance protein ChrB domain-containing protein [Gallionellaceae bacterium]
MNDINHWLTLIISLPTSNATARMRIWRALKSLGCGVLRDGVYLLPDSAAAVLSLEQQAAAVIAAGGAAQIVKLVSMHPAQDINFRKLFNRTDDYATLKQEIDALIGILPAQNMLANKRTLKRLARDFAVISAIDFFPDAARDQIALLLDKATAGLSAIVNPDEPHPTKGIIKKLKREEFHKRSWATRKGLWVDRMASAWLIRRFIDPAAKFKWLDKPQDCPKSALGFDFDGASFTHVGARVTFEVLLASFNLEPDPALQRLAAVVHFLDVGGIPVAEAHGLELILKGMRERCADDDILLHEASIIFDDLYLTYNNEESNDEQ